MTGDVVVWVAGNRSERFTGSVLPMDIDCIDVDSLGSPISGR